MDLYTLTDQFLANEPIDEFVSAIWTERYSVKGEVQLKVEASSSMLDKLADGTFLALRGSKEVMQLETQSIEEGLATIAGQTLDGFLENRMAWFANPFYDGTDQNPSKVLDYTAVKVPGQFLADAVTQMCIAPTAFSGDFSTVNLNWPAEIIPNLSLGAVDISGTAKRMTLPIGPLYDGLAKIAQDEGLGMSVYLESADPIEGYSLKFTTYRGLDHSMGGTAPLVRLVPELDSIQNLKELRSIAYYKNVVYVFYGQKIYKYWEDMTGPEPEGFARRVMVTDAVGSPVGHKETYRKYDYGKSQFVNAAITVVSPAEEAAFLEQNARDALANNNYIRAIDGETSPDSEYQYGTHYTLGDVIELEGLTGTITKARVTEYIRSQDANGEKQYPTISVLSKD